MAIRQLLAARKYSVSYRNSYSMCQNPFTINLNNLHDYLFDKEGDEMIIGTKASRQTLKLSYSTQATTYVELGSD